MPNASEVREFSQYVSEAAETAWTATWYGMDWNRRSTKRPLDKAVDERLLVY